MRKENSSNSGKALETGGMPRTLFQRMFDESLPEINILTKTQVITRSHQLTHTRNQSSVIADRPDREVPSFSYRQVQPNPFLQTPAKNNTPIKNESPTHPRLKALRRRILLKNPRIALNDRPSMIYKSEITAVELAIQSNPKQTPYIKHDSATTEEELDPPPSQAEEEQERTIFRSRAAYRRLPISYEGESQRWLRKIFDQKDYEDSYQDINRQLLRREQLYKSKGLNLKMEKEWRY